MDNLDFNITEEIQDSLLTWFQVAGRDFPWRRTCDPYAVLLAEKLLQQTSVRDSLVQAYNDLTSMYPDPFALANASVDDVLLIFQPLGLHYRAKELPVLAQAVCDQYAGKVPNDLQALLALPGVGDYSARAILCFAFDQDVPVVDTNVARILYRMFALPGKFPTNPARKRNLINLAGQLIPRGKARQFNWALLDLGALICRKSEPDCSKCPVRNLCKYDKNRRL